MKNIFCRGLLSLVLLILFSGVSAQKKQLKIGDKLPDAVWNTNLEMVNYPQKTLTLSAYKDRLILLDFWATWCGGCLQNFPKMESLEKKYGDKIKILAVSNESRGVLEKFFSSKNGQRYKEIHSVAEDQLFEGLFPHRGIPFIVWLKDGKVLNTTDAEQVSEETINEILKGESSSLQTVVQQERDRPLMLSENFDLERGTHLEHYTFFSKGRIRSIGYGSEFHRKGSVVYGRQFTNLPLLSIYSAIAYEVFKQRGGALSAKQIITEVRDLSKIHFNTNTKDLDNEQKLYSYEYIVPYSKADSLYKNMLEDLDRYSGFKASIEKRKVKCLVLSRISTKDKIATKGGKVISSFLDTPSVLQNVPFYYMLSGLNANSDITPLPVVDETGYKGNIDIKISNPNDLKIIQKELLSYDLELKEGVREVMMLVIRDKE
ncbi:TlpA family protein disulfide reductase [Elizabethkingia anophelis]|uniref:TlpA family protein disulfide reductase n=1 Tax=Elizabethkingia anophelis TaxID=1117645 RepID=UPI000999097A|nr:redoxin family protein [Elizabethkingia anophelis]MCT4196694.1 redoxin family protein [Elizabethkingia anophelis]MCT4225362.1 redoxin family protein [Elizabethkingia anophelis]MCT4306953.1 redoxin family protein [Elizabethkingia anophelis]MDV2472712.1 hypothetical protein [Elizabethkingia anophelis]MDV3535840.1 hypothetical protein [Elizabethkingia anophelis]